MAHSVTSDTLKSAIYSHPHRLVGEVDDSGAVGANAEGKFFIEEQKYGADLIQSGVVMGDRDQERLGAKILNWGFNREGADGDFPGTGDAFHSTSQFLEAAARSVLLVQRLDPQGPLSGYLKGWTKKIRATSRWITSPSVAEEGQKHNRPYTHRRWMLAAALSEASEATGDQKLMQVAEQYASDGESLQAPDGMDPEKGGLDISYHCVGLCFAARFYFAVDDPEAKAAVAEMLRKGLRFASGYVSPDGAVDATGSVRTGVETGRSGKVKKVDYKNILQAFVYGGQILNNAKYAQIAAAIGRNWGKKT